jgi:hypothetical protein
MANKCIAIIYIDYINRTDGRIQPIARGVAFNTAYLFKISFPGTAFQSFAKHIPYILK